MNHSSRTSIFEGAVLTIGMRWTDRLIGFISTLILARLLAPKDFGIIAMASVVIGLVDILLDLGVNVALIQNQHATQAHYNTAWTLRLIQTSIASGVVFLVAPLAADYFSDASVEPVLWVMAGGLLLGGLENIGVVSFQKEMRFGLDFQFTFFKRIMGFLVTLLAAYILRSYWALVIGAFAGRAFGVLLSYSMHPMRPMLSLAKVREIFSVSQWVLINSVGVYLNNNFHKIIAGRRTNPAVMGAYTLADEISAMPATEMLAPFNRVLFPAFVQVKYDEVELKRLFLLTQGVQAIVAIPACVGLAMVAHEAVFVLLGGKWLLAVPFVQLLSLANVAQVFTSSSNCVMLTMGKVRNLSVLTWSQIILFSLGAFLFLPHSGATEIALLRMTALGVGFVLAIQMLVHTLPNVSVLDIARTVFRPLMGTCIMTAAILMVGYMLDLDPLSALALKVGIGIVVYPLSLIAIWYAAGKPQGPEQYLINKANELLGRARGVLIAKEFIV